jgi:hypothetical protein
MPPMILFLRHLPQPQTTLGRAHQRYALCASRGVTLRGCARYRLDFGGEIFGRL